MNLDDQRLRRLLHAYRLQHGERSYEYCVVTLPKWRSGRSKMSGLVAERIFDLLPQFVTSSERQQIAEKLWKHLSPSSDNQLLVSPKSSPEEVREALDDYARRCIRSYNFPDRLRDRFAWIANRDVDLTQRLLNHFQQMEYYIAAETIRVRLPIIAEKLNTLHKGLTANATEEIRVGKHRLKIVFTAAAKADDKPQARRVRIARQNSEALHAADAATDDDNTGCLVWILVVGAILWLLNQL